MAQYSRSSVWPAAYLLHRSKHRMERDSKRSPDPPHIFVHNLQLIGDGQIARKWIITRFKQIILLIDQHAADERPNGKIEHILWDSSSQISVDLYMFCVDGVLVETSYY